MSLLALPDWFSLLSNKQKVRAVCQKTKDLIAYTLRDAPTKKYTEIDNWIPAEYIEYWDKSGEKIFWVHWVFGDMTIFERQIMSKALSDYHHIWLNYCNYEFIDRQRKLKIKDPFQISENLQNSFIDRMWWKSEKFHRIWWSLWWERILRSVSKNPDSALSITWWWPSWLWQEKVSQLENIWNFSKIAKDKKLQLKLFLEWFENPEFIPPWFFSKWFEKYVDQDNYKLFLVKYILPFKKASIDSPDIEWNKKRLIQIAEAWVPICLQRWKNDQITPIKNMDTRVQWAWDMLIHQYVSDTARHAIYIDDYRWFNKNQKQFFDMISKK